MTLVDTEIRALAEAFLWGIEHVPEPLHRPPTDDDMYRMAEGLISLAEVGEKLARAVLATNPENE